jgi:carboxymethylenebutenolidase
MAWNRTETGTKKVVLSRASKIVLAIVMCTASTVTAAEFSPLRAQVLIADGVDIPVFVAGPANSDRAIFVAHDWFGVSPLYGELAAHFVEQGYRVAVLDLYGVPHASDNAGAQQLMNSYLQSDAVARAAALRAGLEALQRPGRRVAVMGLSMGGNVAYGLGSQEADLVDATVVIYGGGMEGRDEAQVAAFDGPLLMITGSQDAWALNSMTAVLPRLITAGKSVEFHVLADQPHAYMQPLMNDGAAYDADASAFTLALIDRFLAGALGE